MLFFLNTQTPEKIADINAVLAFQNVDVEWISDDAFNVDDSHAERTAKILMIKHISFRNPDFRFKNMLVSKYINDIYDNIKHIIDLTCNSDVNYSETETDALTALYSFKEQMDKM